MGLWRPAIEYGLLKSQFVIKIRYEISRQGVQFVLCLVNGEGGSFFTYLLFSVESPGNSYVIFVRPSARPTSRSYWKSQSGVLSNIV